MSDKSITLETSLNMFEEAHQILASTRDSSKDIKVPRQTFATLLRDHALMWDFINKLSVEIKE